jgi:hypothetical protein
MRPRRLFFRASEERYWCAFSREQKKEAAWRAAAARAKE